MKRHSHDQRRCNKSGFTIIEVSIATAVLSVLLIIITTVTMNVISIYQKGMTIKSVNSVGRALIDDFTSALGSASALPDNRNEYFPNVSDGGMLCTGSYSYIWNTPARVNQFTVKYKNSSSTEQSVTNFHLLKISDVRRRVCSVYNSSTTTIDITKVSNANDAADNIISEEPRELLSSSEVDLYLYDFRLHNIDDIANRSVANSQILFSATFTLGTLRGVNLADDMRASNCKIGTNDEDEDYDYCAINTFNFAARSAGR